MAESFRTAFICVEVGPRWGRSCKLFSLAALLLCLVAQSLPGAQVRVPEGTLVPLTLRFDVTTENVVKGDRVEFDVSGNVVINDEIVIPEGARAWAIVQKVRGAGKLGAKDASVTYRLMGVHAADGQAIALRLLPSKSRNPQPSDNDIEASSHLPGPGVRKVGAPKGKQYAAYTDIQVFVNATAASQAAPTQAMPAAPAEAPAASPPPAAVAPPQPASVDFRSDPTGGDVVIDGSSVGVTPTTQPLVPGLHDIEIHEQGYQNWKRRMRVEPGSHPTVMARLVKS
jgi:PEGA domain